MIKHSRHVKSYELTVGSVGSCVLRNKTARKIDLFTMRNVSSSKLYSLPEYSSIIFSGMIAQFFCNSQAD